MNTQEQPKTQMLRVAVCEAADVDYINLAAALIRELSGVVRVRVELDAHQLEILYQAPMNGLLQKVHQALLAAGNQFAGLRA